MGARAAAGRCSGKHGGRSVVPTIAKVGRVGTIVEAVNRKQNGRIQFAQGVMGSREWTAISEEELEVGCEAEITAVVGNALTVKRHQASH